MNNKFSIIIVWCAVLFCASVLFTQKKDLYSFNTISCITCGLGFVDSTSVSDKTPHLTAAGSNDSFDIEECKALQAALSSIRQSGDNQKMYDSAKYVIEHCAAYKLIPPVRTDFGIASGGLQDLSNDPNRWPPYREWLKKVLYLNSDTLYYCSDVADILNSFQYFNAERGHDVNGYLAVIKFLQDSHFCLSWSFMDSLKLKSIRSDQYDYWRDTVRNPKLIPLDSTLPSLEELDLQILRGPQYAAVKNAFTPSTKTKLKYLSVSDNPFKEETTLRFGLEDAEYMKIEIFDLLGNKVYSDSKLFNEGESEWRIEGNNLSKGSYYARLSTMGGEIKTVKLVRE